MAESLLEERFARWLRDDAGIQGGRRIVRDEPRRILVSKFEPGFFDHLDARLDRLLGLFDLDAMIAAMEAELRGAPDLRLVEAWHRGTLALLARLAAEHGLDRREQAEVAAGIDSVAAVLDTALWSAPGGSRPHAPLASEVESFREMLSRFQAGRDLFTRYYGDFEGRPVLNHCPGVAYARRFLALGWTAITGTPPG